MMQVAKTLLHQLAQRTEDAFTRIRGRQYYASLYRQMHQNGAFPGHSWRAHQALLESTVPDVASLRILDFGCGPQGGLAAIYGDRVISYDPFVPQYASPPWEKPFDLCFSSDVLEHMTRPAIDELVSHMRSSTVRYVFWNISTRRAHKTLPNGANAHLTVKPASWWLDYLQTALGADFKPKIAIEDLLRRELTVCFDRSAAPDSKRD